MDAYLKNFKEDLHSPITNASSVDEFMNFKLSQEPKHKRFWFNKDLNMGGFGLVSVGTVIISNLFFRRALLLYEGSIVSYGLNSLVAGFSNGFVQSYIFQPKILRGEFQCQLCCSIRGGLYQGILGYIVPQVICFAGSCAVAQRFGVGKLFGVAERKEAIAFWKPRLLSIFRKTKPILLLNVGLGALIAFKQFEISKDVARKITKEEYQGLVEQIKMGI